MAAPARYLFDLDFSRPAPTPAPAAPPRPMIDLDQHLAELVAVEERARAEAFAEGREEGFVAGRTDAESRAAERLADEAGAIASAARALMDTLDAERLAVERSAIDLAVAVARKFAAHLIDREPLAEIRALLADCLGPLRRAPHLAIRLPAADADALKPHVDRIVRETGFEGRIVILGEDDVKRGDCRIEWADGGILRDGDSVAAEIDAAVARWFAARQEAVAGPRDGSGDRTVDGTRRTDP
ncbi:flagellar assembly protein FliH [Siculibacillus lacustris]|uniref:Flagellar assembly protein FliH n=1 Tax=Siculibacillus lacustris TaxID=1549641 RepID=A0A4Q9VPJ0_9HYPH|nr:FliH/SctL family protein [Siculibacillus lacustris]TBW37387.1 flagellar assembly protein FliH [Siculibacillus lacustris]